MVAREVRTLASRSAEAAKEIKKLIGDNVQRIEQGGVQAERAGLSPKHGCRIGICRSCQCLKTSGTVENLQTGEVSSAPNELIRLCISTARSDVSIAL